MLTEDATTERENYFENMVASISILYFLVLVAELYLEPTAVSLKYFIALDTAICFIFLVEYVYFFTQAKDKKHYVKNNLLDLFSTIPFMLLFSFSPITSLLNTFKVLRGLKNCIKIYEFLIRKKVTKTIQVFSLFTMLVIYFSIVIVHVEGATNASLSEFHHGIWWAITTITTVGYGDVTPTTFGGKVAAVFLMIFGIGITSAVGALFVSYILKPFEEKVILQERKLLEEERRVEKKEDQISRTERKILRKLDKIEKQLAQMAKARRR